MYNKSIFILAVLICASISVSWAEEEVFNFSDMNVVVNTGMDSAKTSVVKKSDTGIQIVTDDKPEKGNCPPGIVDCGNNT